MIVLSCGHIVTDFKDSYEVKVKSHTKEFKKTVAYQTVCKNCELELEKENLLLDNERDVDSWLP